MSQYRFSALNPAEMWPFLLGGFISRRPVAGIYQAAEALAHKHADIVTVTTPVGRNIHLVYNPTLISKMMSRENAKVFQKSGLLRGLHSFGGEAGIFSAKHEGWMPRREITAEAFDTQALQRYAHIIESHIQGLMEDWARHGQIDDPYHDLKHFAAGLMLNILFGEEARFTHEEVDAILETMGGVSAHMFSLMFMQWADRPDRVHEEARQALETMGAFLERMIAEYPDSPIVRPFLELHGDLPDAAAHIKEDLFQVMLEATETTAASLFWMLQELARAPEWQEHIAVQLSGGQDNRRHDPIQQVIAESLRMHSVFAVALPRRAMEDYRVELDDGGAVDIAANDMVIFPLAGINLGPIHDTEAYGGADVFNPERHESRRIQARVLGTTFLAGAHVCTGRSLYLDIAEQFLAALMGRFSIAPQPGADEAIAVQYDAAVVRPHQNADAGLMLSVRDEGGAYADICLKPGHDGAQATGKCPFHNGF